MFPSLDRFVVADLQNQGHVAVPALAHQTQDLFECFPGIPRCSGCGPLLSSIRSAIKILICYNYTSIGTTPGISNLSTYPVNAMSMGKTLSMVVLVGPRAPCGRCGMERELPQLVHSSRFTLVISVLTKRSLGY